MAAAGGVAEVCVECRRDVLPHKIRVTLAGSRLSYCVGCFTKDTGNILKDARLLEVSPTSYYLMR
jgi:hypothetical protein